MIGGILGMYMAGFAWSNSEEFLRAFTNKAGATYEHKGITGKMLNKLSKGKIPTNMGLKFAFKGAQSQGAMNLAMNIGAKGLLNYFFNPYIIAGKMALGMAYDSRKEYINDEIKEQIFDLPDSSSNYRLDERYNAISSNTFGDMDRVNYTINELLNSGNLAGNMIDRVFKNM